MINEKKNLNEQAKEILAIAEKHGVEQNFFFITTFKRYQVQINILSKLEKALEGESPLITKEYVKGRGNVYAHPGIGEYNKTATAANQTVTTLMKIILDLREKNDEEDDELIKFITGRK